MNKRALLGTILLAFVVLVLIIGGIFYYQLRTKGVQITSGNFVVDIKYQDNETSQNETNIDEISENFSDKINITNKTSAANSTFNSTIQNLSG